MTIIYSKNKIDGLNGIYANPSIFNGDTENCKLVYTDKQDIKLAYEKKGIKVEILPKVASKKASKQSIQDKD